MSLKSRAPRKSDTNDLRDEFESCREWKLRKVFLDANVDSLSEDRLVCLSKCFVNSIMYGCSYPRAVMREVDSRSSGLLESHQKETREDRKLAAKKKYAMSFVKASDSLSEAAEDQLDQDETITIQSKSDEGTKSSLVEIVDMANYQRQNIEPGTSIITDDLPCTYKVPLTESEERCDLSSDNLVGKILASVHAAIPILTVEEYKKKSMNEKHPLLKKLRQLVVKTLECKEEFAMHKVMKSITKGFGLNVEFKQCKQIARQLKEATAFTVLFNNCIIATGAARNKVFAKRNAMEAALQKLYLPYLRIAEIEGGKRQEIQASVEPFTTMSNHPENDQIDQLCLSATASAQSGTSIFPGKALVSSKDYLPDSLDQFSNKVHLQAQAKETIKVVSQSSQDRKEEQKSFELPPKKKRLNKSNLKSEKVAGIKPSEKKFILVQSSHTVNSPLGILHRSADFSGMLLDVKHTVLSPNSVSCEVRLEGQVIGEASDSNVKTAKHLAASKALEYLGSQCWVLKLKGVDAACKLSKAELLDKIQHNTDVIGESNLGNKMLRRMGWAGGGVGKESNGIVEPIAAQGVLGRAGLGLSSSSAPGAEFEEKLFRRKVHWALRKYMESGNQEDLMFSTEFSKEERKVIHEEAAKLRLRTVSRGTNKNRYMTVGHKRSSNQLLQHISECGGETNSYILLPPGSYQHHIPTESTSNN